MPRIQLSRTSRISWPIVYRLLCNMKHFTTDLSSKWLPKELVMWDTYMIKDGNSILKEKIVFKLLKQLAGIENCSQDRAHPVYPETPQERDLIYFLSSFPIPHLRITAFSSIPCALPTANCSSRVVTLKFRNIRRIPLLDSRSVLSVLRQRKRGIVVDRMARSERFDESRDRCGAARDRSNKEERREGAQGVQEETRKTKEKKKKAMKRGERGRGAGRFSTVKSRSTRGRSAVADEPRLCKVPWRAARADLQRDRRTAHRLLRPPRRPWLKPRYQESA